MKKIILCILVVALTCVTLTSCLEKEEKENEKEKSEGVEEVFNVENPTEKERVLDEIAALYCAESEDGYGVFDHYVIDSKGYPIFTFDEGEECILFQELESEGYSIPKVYNNVTITEINDTVRLRSAIDGKILYTTENTPNVKVAFPTNTDLLIKDGYLIFYERTDAFDGVKYKIGIMNTKGEWVIPLSENNPILQINKYVDIDFFEYDLIYHGEGIIGFNYDYYDYGPDEPIGSVYCLYDINSNSINILQNSGIYRLYALSYDWFFEKGYCLPLISNSRFYGLKISKDGKVEEIPCTFHKDLEFIYGESYYDEYNNMFINIGLYYDEIDDFEKCAIFDSKGNIIKDFGAARLIDTSGFNKEGKAQIVFMNSEESCFYTVVDIMGNFLFEPIKIESENIYNRNGDYVDNDMGSSYYSTVIDDEGNILIDNVCSEIYINNGVAFLVDNETDCYRDLNTQK